MDSWKIVRVSEDFRVIALGLPVPKYKGNPLDPPLRSRFQARDIYYLPFKVSVGINRLSIIKNLPPPECLNKERKGLDLTLNWSCFYYPEIQITHCKQTLLSPPGLSLKGCAVCVSICSYSIFSAHLWLYSQGPLVVAVIHHFWKSILLTDFNTAIECWLLSVFKQPVGATSDQQLLQFGPQTHLVEMCALLSALFYLDPLTATVFLPTQQTVFNQKEFELVPLTFGLCPHFFSTYWHKSIALQLF